MASNPFGITQVDIPGILQSYIGIKRGLLQDEYTRTALDRQQTLNARSDKDYADTQAIKTGLKAAYNPNTGSIDPVKARAAYLAGGDASGAVAYDRQEAENQLKQLDTYAKINGAVVNLLGGVTDQLSYDQAKESAKQLFTQFGHGMHFPDLPDKYDPATVQQLQMRALGVKDRLAAQLAQAKETREAAHQKFEEGATTARIGLERGRLGVEQAREARVTKWGPQPLIGTVVPQHTDDLNY